MQPLNINIYQKQIKNGIHCISNTNIKLLVLQYLVDEYEILFLIQTLIIVLMD